MKGKFEWDGDKVKFTENQNGRFTLSEFDKIKRGENVTTDMPLIEFVLKHYKLTK